MLRITLPQQSLINQRRVSLISLEATRGRRTRVQVTVDRGLPDCWSGESGHFGLRQACSTPTSTAWQTRAGTAAGMPLDVFPWSYRLQRIGLNTSFPLATKSERGLANRSFSAFLKVTWAQPWWPGPCQQMAGLRLPQENVGWLGGQPIARCLGPQAVRQARKLHG